MGKPVRRQVGERGSTTVLFALVFLFVLLPMTGLAIDSAIAFVIKSKLSAAMDGAALAAAGSLNVGKSAQAQTGSARATAQAYFQANFPSGLFNAEPALKLKDIVVNDSAASVRTVTIQATAQSPLYFLSLFGAKTITVSASSQASRRDVNIVLVLDRSGSMQSSGVCGTMKASAQNFVSKFANGRDRLGLITFKGNAEVDFENSLDFQPDLVNKIDQLACNGSTGSAQALSLAHQQFVDADGKLKHRGALNVVLFFTDGQPNGIAALFPAANSCKPPTGYVEGFLSQGPAGVYSTKSVDIADTTETLVDKSVNPGCSFKPVTKDLAFIGSYKDSAQWHDLFGNLISPGFKNLPIFPNKIPIDDKSVNYASWNAADDAANRIRQDGIVIYCIGESKSVDSTFLKRVANTQDAIGHQSQQKTGFYVYSPNGGQLASAFDTIASQILRISQ